VLGGFALMLSAMAMSMFGWYELQLPSGLQSRATAWSNRFEGGSMVGVFVMGGISALVVGPCVAAPLAGALVYISQTRDVWLGGSALFAMAMGMSVPLLLVGVSAGSLLPRAGAWMEHVKHVFGMMLLAVAIWMVSPVLAPALHLLFWAAWLLAGAALLGVFDTAVGHAPTHRHGHHSVAMRAAGWGVLSLSFMLAVGAASGGQSVLQPLAHLRPSAALGIGGSGGSTNVAATGAGAGAGATGAVSQEHSSGLAFQRVASVDALDAAVRESQQKGQAVMLDFYADWCVSCKEYDSFTFSDRAVQVRLRGTTLLQADVTANTAQDKALMKRFGLFGPPGIVFFDAKAPSDASAAAAPAQAAFKIIGYQNAKEFLASLDVGLPR
jgi:thioredoxin:protein disulfide reductase